MEMGVLAKRRERDVDVQSKDGKSDRPAKGGKPLWDMQKEK